MTSKICTKCRREKPLSEFGPNKLGKGGRVSWCKSCMSAHVNALRRGRSVKNASYPPPKDGRCELCGRHPENRLVFDHDHKTNEFRGWICGFCNTGLGLFRDDPELLRLAAVYLERERKAHRPNHRSLVPGRPWRRGPGAVEQAVSMERPEDWQGTAEAAKRDAPRQERF